MAVVCNVLKLYAVKGKAMVVESQLGSFVMSDTLFLVQQCHAMVMLGKGWEGKGRGGG